MEIRERFNRLEPFEGVDFLKIEKRCFSLDDKKALEPALENTARHALFWLTAFCLVASPVLSQAEFQFSQEGSKLVGTFAAGLGEQGWSVALSADGTTAIVGGPLDNGIAGAAWVFTHSNGAGPSLATSWLAAVRLEALDKAGPSRFLPTAPPPS